MSRRRAAILISGGGSNMVALARSMAAADHPAEACLVLSNRPEAGGLARAEEMGIEAACVDHRGFASRSLFDAAVTERLRAAEADIVLMAGFLRIVTPDFIATWEGRMLNIHPSILPLFPGLDTHARALAAGMAVHGCTVHEVTSDLDAGPILGQAVIPVLDGDTPAALAERLLPMEHRLYPEVFRRFVAGDRRRVTILG